MSSISLCNTGGQMNPAHAYLPAVRTPFVTPNPNDPSQQQVLFLPQHPNHQGQQTHVIPRLSRQGGGYQGNRSYPSQQFSSQQVSYTLDCLSFLPYCRKPKGLRKSSKLLGLNWISIFTPKITEFHMTKFSSFYP